MDPISQQLMMGAAGAGGPKTYVEDVFSTWLYTGNGSTQTITNGIDLAGKGGLVWIKQRSSVADHFLFDTARGVRNHLNSNNTGAQEAAVGNTDLYQYNSDGYTLGANYWGGINTSSETFASWTFRKAAKFFDVVTYTGDGTSSQTINHNLGSVPGVIIVKDTGTSGNWSVYHRSVGNTKRLLLNTTDAESGAFPDYWNNTTPTSTQFTVGSNLNSSSGKVAYLFAHDAGGFGDSGAESVVKCGTFTCDGSGNVGTVDLGWEPQWILAKKTNAAQNWQLWDNMRGFALTSSSTLIPNASDAEVAMGGTSYLYPTATGFAGSGNFFGPSAQVIYIAIRRGPMKTPTDATKVFSTFARSGTGAAATITTPSFPVDFILGQERTAIGLNGGIAVDRLRGAAAYLRTPVTAAEGSNTAIVSALDSMTGFSLGASDALNGSSSTYANWIFRRAPGFFDVVAATSTNSSNQRFTHNLGIAPELIILKSRSVSGNWFIYLSSQGRSKYHYFDGQAINTLSNVWGTSDPTATDFGFASNVIYSTGTTLIAYLFATVSGVSKVGSYTGTGTTLQIDCGFTNGARFVLIKRTDSTGDWYVWDTARGIVSGNDPYLLLNSTAAEVTNTDYIDPYSAGFEISSTAPAAINASGGSYIFLAVA